MNNFKKKLNMSKRLGFKPRFINSQPRYHNTIDGIGTGTFGTFANYRTISSSPAMRENFDLVNKTFSNKVYVCVDKETRKYAIGYDPKDKSTKAPVIVKPINLEDKSEWMTIDAGVGILNFFYSLKSYIHIELEKDEEHDGIIPVMRSDVWQNAFFDFGNNGEIIVNFLKSGKQNDDRYCLAFRKDGLSYSGESVETLAQKWNNDYKYFDSSNVNYDDDGNKKEGFMNKCWNFVKEKFVERADDTTYLELVKLDGIDKNKYSYTWAFQEVWDMRTATNIALETKQIMDLESIDKEALNNKEQAYDILRTQYLAEKQHWDQEKAEYDSHFMTRFY